MDFIAGRIAKILTYIIQATTLFDLGMALKWRQTSYLSIIHRNSNKAPIYIYVEPQGGQASILYCFLVGEVGTVALLCEAMSHVHMALFVPMRVSITKGRTYQVAPSIRHEKKTLIRTQLPIHTHSKFSAGVLCSLACANSCETHMSPIPRNQNCHVFPSTEKKKKKTSSFRG